jgi:hypothetical protein
MDYQLSKIPSPWPSPRGRGNKFFFLSLWDEGEGIHG